MDQLESVLLWENNGQALKDSIIARFGKNALSWKICNTPLDHQQGVAYSTIGDRFSARLHRYHGLLDVSGASLVPHDPSNIDQLLCTLNTTRTANTLAGLNPSVNFQLADLKRLPFKSVPFAQRDPDPA